MAHWLVMCGCSLDEDVVSQWLEMCGGSLVGYNLCCSSLDGESPLEM